MIAAEAAERHRREDGRVVAEILCRAQGDTIAAPSIGDILDEIQSLPPSDKPFVIADAADNAGGGAGADSTFILDAILKRGIRGAALALFWDPLVAGFAADAGVGAQLNVRLGGKTGPAAGDPVDVSAIVRAVSRDGRQSGIGLEQSLGLAAVLEIEGNLAVVNSRRQQVFSPACFTELGIDPKR